MRVFHVTYDRVTPDSAERGDIDDSGFMSASGAEVSLAGVWGVAAGAVKAAHAMRLGEALDVFGYGYGRHGVENNCPAIYAADSHVDYSTGAATRLALHCPDSISGASYNRVLRLITGEVPNKGGAST